MAASRWRWWWRTSVLVIICGFLALPHRAEAQEITQRRPADIAADIDAYADALARSGELSGTLLVAQGHRPIYERAFGMASYELGLANTGGDAPGDRIGYEAAHGHRRSETGR